MVGSRPVVSRSLAARILVPAGVLAVALWSAAAAPASAQSPAAESIRLARLVPASDQYDSLSCWAVAIASKFDLEAARRTGKAVKFSPRYLLHAKTLADVVKLVVAGEFKRTSTVLCEKCREESVFYEQGAGYAEIVDLVLEVGLVPERDYAGFPKDDLFLFRALNKLIGEYERNPALPRDREAVTKRVRRVLDAHLGRPPASFVFQGMRMTPQQLRERMLPALAQAKAVEVEFDPEGGRSVVPVEGTNGRAYRIYMTPHRQEVLSALGDALRRGAPVLLEYDYVERAHKGARIGYRINRLPQPSAAPAGKRELLGHYVLALDARFDAKGALQRVLIKNTFGPSLKEARSYHWIERDYFRHFVAVEVPDDMVEALRGQGVLADPQMQASSPKGLLDATQMGE